MDIITTSLEALIQRATSVSNQGPDTAAIDAFCGLVNKEPECAQMAAKFITAKIYSLNEWEALQALLVLENCMKRCGGVFHAEVGKFRFLNELVKLVSPKYLGSHTPEPVRQRVLELMHLWTVQYPRETKIKEAYDMLKKQGVVKEEIPVPVKEPTQRHHQSSILQDEEKSQLLQKLLQSKNPDDLQAANRLIKSMVKEDERRLEEKWRHTVELETVVNNCRLLKEMLDNYSSDSSSPHDLELIKELYTTCQNLRPVLFKLAGNNSDASFCNDVLTANDELGEVFNKYNVVIQGFSNASHQFSHIGKGSDSGNTPSLLDLTPSPIQNVEDTTEQLSRLGLDLSAPTKQSLNEGIKKDNSGYLAALDEIFNSQPVTNIPSASQLMSPVNSTAEFAVKGSSVKNKGLEELDLLGESLLKESLSASKKNSNQLNKSNVKLPVSELNCTSSPSGPDVLLDNLTLKNISSSNDILLDDPLIAEPDKVKCIISEDKVNLTASNELPKVKIKEEKVKDIVVMPLGDLKITLDDIKPSSVPPLHAVEDRNGINVVLHLAKDCPRPDVAVFVVTTSSKSQSPLTNFLFQPVVPKCCRLRLLSPSSTTLPSHNPFLPPSAITQVMLIASPTKEPIILKFVVSYTMEEETVTEMGEINCLPLRETATS